MATFATHVHVSKKDGTVVVFEAGQAVPGWAKQVISNPSAFLPEEETTEEVPEGSGPSLEKAAAEAADDELRTQLEAKGLPTDGTHEELVARLAEHEE